MLIQVSNKKGRERERKREKKRKNNEVFIVIFLFSCGCISQNNGHCAFTVSFLKVKKDLKVNKCFWDGLRKGIFFYHIWCLSIRLSRVIHVHVWDVMHVCRIPIVPRDLDNLSIYLHFRVFLKVSLSMSVKISFNHVRWYATNICFVRKQVS